MTHRIVFVVSTLVLLMSAIPASAVDDPPYVSVSTFPIVVDETPAGSGFASVNLSSYAYVDGYPYDTGVTCVVAETPVAFDGETFPVGETWIDCTASWFAGGPSTQFSMWVWVEEADTTPPVLTAITDPWVVGENAEGAWVYLAQNITVDEPLMSEVICETDPWVDINPWGYTYMPTGEYSVTCSGTDWAGNTGYGGYTLDVVDPSEYFQLEIRVVDARVDTRTGVAIVTLEGTALADGWIWVNGSLTQTFAHRFYIRASDETYGDYQAGSTWTGQLEFTSDNGLFMGGKGTLQFQAGICTGEMEGMCDWTGPDPVVVAVQLKGARR